MTGINKMLIPVTHFSLLKMFVISNQSLPLQVISNSESENVAATPVVSLFKCEQYNERNYLESLEATDTSLYKMWVLWPTLLYSPQITVWIWKRRHKSQKAWIEAWPTNRIVYPGLMLQTFHVQGRRLHGKNFFFRSTFLPNSWKISYDQIPTTTLKNFSRYYHILFKTIWWILNPLQNVENVIIVKNLSFIRELSFFSWTRGLGKMQVGSFLKILKNKGAKFSGISYFGGRFLKTNHLAKIFIHIWFWAFSY